MGCVVAGIEPDEVGRADWPVEVRLLGSFALLKSGRPVHSRAGSKTEALLSTLALGWKDGVHRDTLLCTLWPDSDTALASQSLHTLVYSLHSLLGDVMGGAAPVINMGGAYRLNREAGVGVDLAQFEAWARYGDRLRRALDLAGACAAYSHAVSLYRGDLNCGTDLSAVIERERLRALYLTVCARLASFYASQGDASAALTHALRVLQCDPCREDAHRLAMQSYVRLGERAQALRQYRLCERILHAEFDMAPEQETVALFERIRLAPELI